MDPRTPAPNDLRREIAPGYSIARIVNGGWQLSEGHRRGAIDVDAAVEGLLKLVDAGLTTFDCGDIYVGVEELLGRMLRRHSERRSGTPIQVHTKLVPDRDALSSIDRKYVERIVDRSLRRLGVERLDLVQLAWWDYSVPRYVETALWLDELRLAGKIRLLGATNFDVSRLREILDAGVSLVSHQVQYSLIDRRPERGMVELCRDRGVHLLAYGTLAGGFLSERYLEAPPPSGQLPNRSLTKYRLMIEEIGGWERFQDLLHTLKEIADRHDVSVSNVALRWVLERPQASAAVVGVAGAERLDDNMRVFFFRLSDHDLRALEPYENAGPEGDVYAAERMPKSRHAAIMRYNLNREQPT